LISHFSDETGVKHKEISANSSEEAIKSFFDDHVETYSKDSTGFAFFKEDFFDEGCPLGAISQIEE
jgi:hypothetical protein